MGTSHSVLKTTSGWQSFVSPTPISRFGCSPVFNDTVELRFCLGFCLVVGHCKFRGRREVKTFTQSPTDRGWRWRFGRRLCESALPASGILGEAGKTPQATG